MASNSANLTLSVTYTSPANEPFVLDQTLPPISSASVAEKTKYLNALGTAVVAMQERVNKELTARMDQDNTAAAALATSGSQKKSTPAVDDAKEEENYGEEVQEEED